MAKKKKTQAQNLSRLSNKRDRDITPVVDFPHHIRVPRGVALARSKHINDHTPREGLPIRPTLGDRFHALPTEIRLHIFSLLLVQPVKWQLLHHLDCPLRITDEDISRKTSGPSHSNDCVRCYCYGLPDLTWWDRISRFRSGWNPWRSAWAPEVMNPYVCSDCWDGHLRPIAHPNAIEAEALGFLRCLCARRANLQTLLVCHRWYEEAGRVLYSSNTFAFESAFTFLKFISHLPPHRRTLITKISIMAYVPRTDDEQRPDPISTAERTLSTLSPTKTLGPVFLALRSLPALTHLSLDATYLTNRCTVTSLQRLGLRNLRSMRFVIRNRLETPPPPPRRGPKLPPPGSDFVSPSHVNARLLVGGLAEAVARSIKGQRVRWLKDDKNVTWAVERERRIQTALLLPLTTPDAVVAASLTREAIDPGDGTWCLRDEAVYYDEDVSVWESLYRRFGRPERPMHAYLPVMETTRRKVWGRSSYSSDEPEEVEEEEEVEQEIVEEVIQDVDPLTSWLDSFGNLCEALYLEEETFAAWLEAYEELCPSDLSRYH